MTINSYSGILLKALLKSINSVYRYNVAIPKIVGYGVSLWGIILVLSAILKIIEPTNTIATIKIVLWQPVAQNMIIAVLVALILLESMLGFMLIVFRHNIISLLSTLLLNTLFILVSYKLNTMSKLSDCGCFGRLSSSFSDYHFIGLYLFTTLIMLNILTNILYKNKL